MEPGTVGAQVTWVPPPMIFAGSFGAGLLIDRWIPWRVGRGRGAVFVGRGLLAAGSAVAAAGVTSVLARRTTIIPHHAVSTLVTGGIYRYTRNPMYLGFAIAQAGAALMARTWWPIATLPAAIAVVRRLVIEPEERYLTERFPDAYPAYRRAVRRWI